MHDPIVHSFLRHFQVRIHGVARSALLWLFAANNRPLTYVHVETLRCSDPAALSHFLDLPTALNLRQTLRLSIVGSECFHSDLTDLTANTSVSKVVCFSIVTSNL